MTSEQFRKLAVKLFGPHRGWQSRCADALKVDRASVSRWIKGDASVPGPVEAAIKCWYACVVEKGDKVLRQQLKGWK